MVNLSCLNETCGRFFFLLFLLSLMSMVSMLCYYSLIHSLASLDSSDNTILSKVNVLLWLVCCTDDAWVLVSYQYTIICQFYNFWSVITNYFTLVDFIGKLWFFDFVRTLSYNFLAPFNVIFHIFFAVFSCWFTFHFMFNCNLEFEMI